MSNELVTDTRAGTGTVATGGGLVGETERLAEAGRPLPQPTTPGPPGTVSQPPNDGLWVVPSFMSFSAVWNSVSRVYRYSFDEALRHSRTNAIAYRRDPVVFEALRARQMPVAGLEWHIDPRNENDPAQADHAKKCRDAIEETPNLQQLIMYLQEAIWYGRYGARLVYDWDYADGYRRAVVRDHSPINGDKLVFRYSGEVGILVGAQYQGPWLPTDRGRAHIYDADERQTVIIHQFEREDADYYDGEMAGRVAGVGVRDRLYWFLFLKQRVLAWMMEFLERVGAGGLTVYYYESGNPSSLNEVREAAEKQKTNTAILFPRYSDKKVGPGIERLEPSMAGADMLYRLVAEYFDNIIRRLILGQSLSAEATGTGLGTGVADLHADTLNKIIKYDARNLQETLTRDFVSTISRHIDPYQRIPKWKFEVDRPNASEHLEAMQALFEMGADIDEDDARSVLGLKKPKPGSAILSRYGPLGVAGFMASGGGMQQGQAQQDGGGGQNGQTPPNPTVIPGSLRPGDPVANPLDPSANGPQIDPRMNVLIQALMGGGGFNGQAS